MPKLRVHNFSISLDVYAAGPDQSLADPLGVGGMQPHESVFATPTGRAMIGMDPSDLEQGIDDGYIAQGDEGIAATIMGRNMFGPFRHDRAIPRSTTRRDLRVRDQASSYNRRSGLRHAAEVAVIMGFCFPRSR